MPLYCLPPATTPPPLSFSWHLTSLFVFCPLPFMGHCTRCNNHSLPVPLAGTAAARHTVPWALRHCGLLPRLRLLQQQTLYLSHASSDVNNLSASTVFTAPYAAEWPGMWYQHRLAWPFAGHCGTPATVPRAICAAAAAAGAFTAAPAETLGTTNDRGHGDARLSAALAQTPAACHISPAAGAITAPLLSHRL